MAAAASSCGVEALVPRTRRVSIPASSPRRLLIAASTTTGSSPAVSRSGQRGPSRAAPAGSAAQRSRQLLPDPQSGSSGCFSTAACRWIGSPPPSHRSAMRMAATRTSRADRRPAPWRPCRLDRVESVERPQRMQPRPPILRVARRACGSARHDRSCRRARRAAAARYRATSRSDATASRPARRPRRLRRARRTESRARRFVDDAIDPAESGGLLQPAREDLVAQIHREREAMLDDPAIHVGDVHRAVGRVREEDRTEALVGRRQELAALVRFARAPMRRPSSSSDDRG